MDESFVRSVSLIAAERSESRVGYPWDLAAIAALAGGLALDAKVTYLIGENGSGKSTLLEAIAVAAGMNAEGGSSNFAFSTRDSHSDLWRAIRLVRGVQRPRTDFFLRAESVFTATTYLEGLRGHGLDGNPFEAYGGISLHEQSHGESFLAVLVNRFGPAAFICSTSPKPPCPPRTASRF